VTGRMIVGVIVANMAGPCLIVLRLFLLTAFTDPARLNLSDGAYMFLAFGVFLLMSWAGMLFTIFPASLLVAWIGYRAGWCSAWIYGTAGALISGIFNMLIPPLIFGSGEEMLALFALYSSMGAICGWIYWVIALRNQADIIAEGTQRKI
jgi:hypothetical protein